MLSFKSSGRTTLIRAVRIGILCVISFQPAYASVRNACANAAPLELNGSHRSYGAGGIDFFEVDVPTSGYLMVQIVVPLDAAAPKVGLLGEDCRSPVTKSTASATFATGFVLKVREPGAYRFGVAAQDSRLRLGRYKVMTGFVSKSDLSVDPGGQSTEDPDPQPEPIGLKSLCHPSPGDDHGDVFLCASTLMPGASRKGTLTNSWNDDRDVFTFTLTEWQTVEIEASGDARTLGALYDAHGQRLQVDEASLDAGFRIVATLAPGRYYVGVEAADGTTGEYSLSLEPVTWQISE